MGAPCSIAPMEYTSPITQAIQARANTERMIFCSFIFVYPFQLTVIIISISIIQCNSYNIQNSISFFVYYVHIYIYFTKLNCQVKILALILVIIYKFHLPIITKQPIRSYSPENGLYELLGVKGKSIWQSSQNAT